MLIKNPLNAFLYKTGYRGVQNIFEYWQENKNVVLSSYKNKSADEDIIEFKYKVRWGSVFGLYLRMEIDALFRECSNCVLPFNDIKVLYDGKMCRILDFSNETMAEEVLESHVDLRGISILDRKIANVIFRDVDFSYAALDECEFVNVTFENCKLNCSSFIRSKLIGCRFDEKCIMTNNDFSNTYLDSIFDCSIIDPHITYLNFWKYRTIETEVDSKYIKYTIVKNPSFANQCNDKRIKDYAMKQW